MEAFRTLKASEGAGIWAWSQAPAHQPMLAMRLPSGAIGICTADGRPLPGNSVQVACPKSAAGGTAAAQLAWHPLQPLLAVAWQNGSICLWDAASRNSQEGAASPHIGSGAITSLAWSPDGERLAAGDDGGKLSLWRTDNGLHPVLVASLQEQGGGGIGALAWSGFPPPPNTRAVEAGQTSALFYAAASAAAGGAATIKRVDTGGRSGGVVHDVGEHVAALLWYPERDQLIAVTAGGTLLLLGQPRLQQQQQGTTDGSAQATAGTGAGWDTVFRAKCAGGGGSGATAPQIAWAAPHVLASAWPGDGAVRLLDLEADENIALPLVSFCGDGAEAGWGLLGGSAGSGLGGSSSAAGGGAPGRLACLVGAPAWARLAVADSAGNVAIYRQASSSPGGSGDGSHEGDGGDSNNAAAADTAIDESQRAWELLYSFKVAGSPLRITWGPEPGLLAIGCGDGGLHIAAKVPLHLAFNGGAAAVQVADGTIVVATVASPDSSANTSNSGSGACAPSARWAHALVRTQLAMQGLCVTPGGGVLVHDGTTAEVYAVADDGSSSLVGQLPVQGAVVASASAPTRPGSGAAGAPQSPVQTLRRATGQVATPGASPSASQPPGSSAGSAGGYDMRAGINPAAVALMEGSVLRLAGDRVEVCNFAGTIKQTFAFETGGGTAGGGSDPASLAAGPPALLDACRDLVVVASRTGTVRVLRLTGREVRPHAGPGALLPNDGSAAGLWVDSTRVNAAGSMVAATARRGPAGPRDGRVFLFCSEAGAGPAGAYDFGAEGRVPVKIVWNAAEPRLLAVQVEPAPSDISGSRPPCGPQTGVSDTSAARGTAAAGRQAAGGQLELALLFACPTAGLLLQEYQVVTVGGATRESSTGGSQSRAPRSRGAELLGLAVPHLYFATRGCGSSSGNSQGSTGGGAAGLPQCIERVPLQGFVGMQDADAATRAALIEFSYRLALGRLGEAFSAVAAVRSPAVWSAMAHTAIKAKRLDVAEHCLASMEHARGARALREAAALPEPDARVASVAVHLGLASDAARLLAGCGRWDLLVALHRSAGRWDEAAAAAAAHDRPRLPAVRAERGRHLERCGDLKGAAAEFEAAGVAADEVPRMMLAHGQADKLEDYVMERTDPTLLAWWGRYCESRGAFDKAIHCYQRTGNHLAICRIHCATAAWAAADQLVATSKDPAAAYHLGRVYEAQGRIEDALKCFGLAGRHAHAARLAKQHGLLKDLLTLALQAPGPVMLEAADCLLAEGNPEGAALLYRRAGRPARALEVAQAAGLYALVDAIAGDLGDEGAPELQARAAAVLLAAGQYDRAARLYARAGMAAEALELVEQHDVPLTDGLAEALTPERPADGFGEESRRAVLLRIAKAAKRQGLWLLATQKFTQAGDRVKAIRALVRSGDTERVVRYANVSRQPEVYLLAANYLQSTDWRGNPQIAAEISGFYSRAGAFDALSAFHDARAAHGIEEAGDYGAAAQALDEAARQMARSDAPYRDTRLADLSARAAGVRSFLAARAALGAEGQQGAAAAEDPTPAIQICQRLLDADSASVAGGAAAGQQQHAAASAGGRVRSGDVFALLAGWCAGRGDFQHALLLLQQMAGKGLQPDRYVAPNVIRTVCEANGVDPVALAALAAGSSSAGAVGSGGKSSSGASIQQGGAVRQEGPGHGRRRGTATEAAGVAGAAGAVSEAVTALEDEAIEEEELPSVGDA